MAEPVARPPGRAAAPGAREHLYGGQAVIEGVMMRGRDHWAVAVRRPDGGIHLESHDVEPVTRRFPWLGKPGLRGVVVLGQSLRIGMRALRISADAAAPEDERLSSGQMALSMALAVALFLGLFIALPAAALGWADRWLGSGLLANVLEGVFRVALFLGYLALIGRTAEIRRVFEYHGAEHKTIAAYEHGDELTPEAVDRYPTVHVRCGTNFLLIVMILTILAFALFGDPPLAWRIGSRLLAIPLVAAVAYELLRLGARFPRSTALRVLMAPGLWLQRITTQPPARDQIEVAIAAFTEVRRREAEAGAPPPP
ncbi:MAG TPA: DUF1385 domain-containing protein [Actinomycetota bacterium]|nr:DUF1385 domain-containing protein [Actinomycetota bacterium]